MKYIRFFNEIGIDDIADVGGKNASLGEMIQNLSAINIRFPFGFAVTAEAYWHYINYNNCADHMRITVAQLKKDHDLSILQTVGGEIRDLLVGGQIPDDLVTEIVQAYHMLSDRYKQTDCDVAVRSSATAEDLPTASFAGQQETFLNVSGENEVLEAYKKCVASLFTDRAIAYRIEQGFDHMSVALSVGIQKMVRSDKAVSGVAFSLDTESGHKDVVMIEASYGLGETIVKGIVIPDEYMVHKPTLMQSFKPIIKKQCGQKKVKLVYADNGAGTKEVHVSKSDQQQFVLSNDEIIELAQSIVAIEKYYSDRKKAWSPMDVEWAKDGDDGLLYIVQARSETIYGSGKVKTTTFEQYALQDGDVAAHKEELIASGLSVGKKIASGIACVITSIDDAAQLQDGDIIVTGMTDPDWVPLMKRATGIITDQGGRTCHAAIVSRELGIPAVVGTGNGTEKIIDGTEVTIDCSRGVTGLIYKGRLSYDVHKVELDTLPELPVALMLNIADPSRALELSFLPVAGVGLARIEFIISNTVKVHPMALIHPDTIDDATKQNINAITAAYVSTVEFFVQTLAQSIGMIAAAFYPRPVIVRFSDFKSNEYRNLIGGTFFEPIEENPMLGLRGASRYYSALYKEAFYLECQAITQVRDVMGLKNLKVMVPFVRTISEAERVIALMAENGLERGKDGLEVVMMCEIPSNVVCIEEFSAFFNGFSIGSNDLTQLVLGVDRDSEVLSSLFDERDTAVKKMMQMAVIGAHAQERYIGICGQAPSDYPEVAEFLMQQGIDSLSLNPDSVLPFLLQHQR